MKIMNTIIGIGLSITLCAANIVPAYAYKTSITNERARKHFKYMLKDAERLARLNKTSEWVNYYMGFPFEERYKFNDIRKYNGPIKEDPDGFSSLFWDLKVDAEVAKRNHISPRRYYNTINNYKVTFNGNPVKIKKIIKEEWGEDDPVYWLPLDDMAKMLGVEYSVDPKTSYVSVDYGTIQGQVFEGFKYDDDFDPHNNMLKLNGIIYTRANTFANVFTLGLSDIVKTKTLNFYTLDLPKWVDITTDAGKTMRVKTSDPNNQYVKKLKEYYNVPDDYYKNANIIKISDDEWFFIYMGHPDPVKRAQEYGWSYTCSPFMEYSIGSHPENTGLKNMDLKQYEGIGYLPMNIPYFSLGVNTGGRKEYTVTSLLNLILDLNNNLIKIYDKNPDLSRPSLYATKVINDTPENIYQDTNKFLDTIFSNVSSEIFGTQEFIAKGVWHISPPVAQSSSIRGVS